MTLRFDEIGYWSEVKLDIIENYARPYSLILSKTLNPKLFHVYIDAFAGAGTHISRGTGGMVAGSPQIALNIDPPFKEYYFIDTDCAKIAELNKLIAQRPEAHVCCGDCNEVLINEIFPKIQYRDYKRGLCLLDPYGLDLKWHVIKTAGQMKTIDLILNFPVMDMNRNVLWNDPTGVDMNDIERMNDFWGDSTWKSTAYKQVKDLFGDIHEIKEPNRHIALAFQERLRKKLAFSSSQIPFQCASQLA